MSKPCRAERSNRGSEVTREISVNTSSDNAGRLADCAWAKREVSSWSRKEALLGGERSDGRGKRENEERETNEAE